MLQFVPRQSFSLPSANILVAPIKQRNLLSFQGKDVYEFLNKMTTNLIQNSNPTPKYSALLSPSGKTLADLIITPKTDSLILVEVELELTERIISYLENFILSKQVKIHKLSELSVFSAFGPASLDMNLFDPQLRKDFFSPWPKVNSSLSDLISSTSKDCTIFSDPRNPIMGFRIYAPNIDEILNEIKFSLPLSLTNFESYHNWRLLNGIVEGSKDHYPDSICFETNLDLVNGISFEKGCYPGQELVSRTFHKGIVRKRILPFRYKSNLQHFDFLQNNPKIPIYGVFANDYPYLSRSLIKKSTDIGHDMLSVPLGIVTSVGAYGFLGQIRSDLVVSPPGNSPLSTMFHSPQQVEPHLPFINETPFYIQIDDEQVEIDPHLPSWWPWSGILKTS